MSPPALLRAAILPLLLTAVASWAGAHATLVIGNLEVSPDPPVPGTPLTITLRLEDTLLTPVEKAFVRVELRDLDPSAPTVPESAIGSEASEFLSITPDVTSERFTETEVKGTYRGVVETPHDGEYTLSVRDTTFLNEEAIANVRLVVGGKPNGAIAFVLPPTPTQPKSLSTWLIWLIGIPLVVGVVTTVLVLRRPAEPAAQPAAEDEGASGSADSSDPADGSEPN